MSDYPAIPPTLRAMLVSLSALLAGCILAAFNLHRSFPDLNWVAILSAHDELPAAIAFYADLPRIVVGLLAGAALGLSGCLFQQVLRNPLAEPSTLGVSAGAYLALVLSAVYLPGLLLGGRILLATCGAAVSIALVMAIAARQSFSALSISLAGLTINLVFSALASIIVTFHRDGVVSLSFWGSGSLQQSDWCASTVLTAALAPAIALVVPMARSLSLFSLRDDSMSALGVSPKVMRLLSLGLATWVAAVVAACVGIIGFVGLVAPWLARLLGARRPSESLWISAVLGAALLLTADQILIFFGPVTRSIPAGLITALIGAPVLLILIRQRQGGIFRQAAELPAPLPHRPGIRAGALLFATVAILSAVMLIGADEHGLHLQTGEGLVRAFPWRWPRVLAAAGSGTALGVAGLLMQRLTCNPMASPEVLGVSSGAVLGALVAVLTISDGSFPLIALGAGCGAFCATGSTLLIGRRSKFAPDQLLLVGIGLGTIMSALGSVFAILPDPRFQSVQLWLSGSTDRADPQSSILISCIAMVGLFASVALHRWPAVLTLGSEAAGALGMELGRARWLLLVLVSILTGASTLVVGPLSFVGLMAPHLASAMGMRRVREQIFATALSGSAIMVVADWIGRIIVFPYQIPAGLFASLIGGGYFLLAMKRLR